MIWRRWLSLGCLLLSALSSTPPAAAQANRDAATQADREGSPPAERDASQQTDRDASTQTELNAAGSSGISAHSAGSSGADPAASVGASGGFGASVPLDLPAPRGNLPVPVHISYSERGVGAAGLGWDVPLSFIRRDTTAARRRPINAPGVAPQGREQVSLVLEGRRIDLVRTTTAWVARYDAPAIEVREQSDGTWVMFDGQGRTYRFAQVSSALAGTGLWLLRDVSGAGGSKVQLDYSVTTPNVSGTTALAIDLVGVSYNSHPTTAGCFKNTVALMYDSPSSAPLSVSMLGTAVMARMHKLTAIDVTSKESCGSAAVRLRRYQLSYGADPDTQLPRLQNVKLLGRAGTPEASTQLPIAGYAYGTATSAGALQYQASTSSSFGNLGSSQVAPPGIPNIGNRFITDRTMLDVTGDTRPDIVELSSGTMLARNNASAVNAIDFETSRQLANGATLPDSFDLRTSRNIGGTSGLQEELVWRQMMDVNGDGRVDLVVAEPNQWVMYLNTPDPAAPSQSKWVRRTIATAALMQQLKSRGYPVSATHFPLARRLTMLESARVTCWFPLSIEWFQFTEEEQSSNLGCDVYTGPFQNKSMTDWELKDINGDGYPDLVFNSSPIVSQYQVLYDERQTQTQCCASVVEILTLMPRAGNHNKLEAVFNVAGMNLTDGVQPFSAPVTLRTNEPCGVSQSIADFVQDWKLKCSLVDVNGDGITDRVNLGSVMLGTGNLAAGSFFTPGAILTLPGWLEMQQNNAWSRCVDGVPPGTTFQVFKTTGLRDVTGDGIPDHLIYFGPGTWKVSIGTGAGFTSMVPIQGVGFELSSVSTECAGTISTTTDGLVDVDGDGKVDVVRGGQVFQLMALMVLAGHPQQGA